MKQNMKKVRGEIEGTMTKTQQLKGRKFEEDPPDSPVHRVENDHAVTPEGQKLQTTQTEAHLTR
jgi:hypothetical protein